MCPSKIILLLFFLFINLSSCKEKDIVSNPKYENQLVEKKDKLTLSSDSTSSINNNNDINTNNIENNTDKTKNVEITQSVKKPKKKKQYSSIYFEKDTHHFGTITEGDTVNIDFNFINKGKAPLEIKSANVTCGCTQPTYPFIEIPYKKSGIVDVQYISIGKSGPQEASVTIKTNGYNSPVVLYIKGHVTPKDSLASVKNDSI